MDIVNHYILVEKSPSDTIDHQLKVVKNPNSISISVPPDPIELISKLLSVDQNEWDRSRYPFKSKITFDFRFNAIIQPFNLELTSIDKIHYMSVSTKAKTKIRTIDCMEEFHKTIKNEKCSLQKHYDLITTYDSVSEYYCNKIFPKIAQFERQFRRLLFNVYLLNYGRNYHIDGVNQDLYNQVARYASQNKPGAISPKIEFFYLLTLGQMDHLLFKQEWLEVDSLAMNKFLADNPDRSKLKDSELRKFIKEFQPKSRWERLFGSEGFPTIQHDFDTFKYFRNKVAHNGFFDSQDYDTSKSLLQKLINYTNQVIIKTETIDFYNKINANMMESLRKLTSTIGSMFNEIISLNYNNLINSIISDNIKNFDQLNFNDYIEKLRELSEFDYVNYITLKKRGNATDPPEGIQ